MTSVTQLIGSEYVMVDGTVLVTEVIRNGSEDRCLYLILKSMIEHEDMVAGLDITWSQSSINRALIAHQGLLADRALLAICTRIGCILLRLHEYRNYPFLENFLDNKDITFFGVHVKEDVKRMRKRRLGIRNVVDVSDLAADVLNKPRLRALGVRRLASEVLLWPFQTRYFSNALVNWDSSDLHTDQIECVTINAYAAYKMGNKLLEL